jgi:hypothetical protein
VTANCGKDFDRLSTQFALLTADHERTDPLHNVICLGDSGRTARRYRLSGLRFPILLIVVNPMGNPRPVFRDIHCRAFLEPLPNRRTDMRLLDLTSPSVTVSAKAVRSRVLLGTRSSISRGISGT